MDALWHPISISAGAYHATIDTRGASLAGLSYHRLPLTRSYTPGQIRPAYSGASLAPWPNRVVDGRWEDDGTQRQLAITEVERHHALHGLVSDTAFRITQQSDAHVQLSAHIPATDGYPYPLDVFADFRLDDTGLCWQLTASSPVAGAPIGLGMHPYLCIGGGQVDDWSLAANTAQLLSVNGERLLPGELHSPPPAWDFASGAKPLAGQVIDHAFQTAGQACATLASAEANRELPTVAITSDATWLQIYTCDAPGPAHRKFVAIEPQTCAPNALANLADPVLGMARRAGGEAARLTMRIRAY